MPRFAETEVQIGGAVMAGTAYAALGALTRHIDAQRAQGWHRFHASRARNQAVFQAVKDAAADYAAKVARSDDFERAAFLARRMARAA